MAKIVIIGAGIGGLATANLLAQDGHTVQVIEKNDQLGGRAGRFTKDGFTFDTGPSWYLMPEVFETYYRLLGTSAQKELDLIKLSPAYKVFNGVDAPITISGNIETDSKTFDAIEPGAGSQLKRYVAKSSETYRLALKHFLYSNFSNLTSLVKKDILAKGAEFATLATTPIHRHVSRYFKHPQLQQILEYPMVFLGSSPFQAPALYSLMSALDFDEGVYYPRGTMYAVVESLVRIGTQLGVTYTLNKQVTAITTKEGSATGVALVDGSTIDADIVISNADLHFT